MPYYRKTIFAGGVVEVQNTFVTNRGRGGTRAPKELPTPEAVQNHNDDLAETKLRHLLYCNFKAGDWHLTLTYAAWNRPDPVQAKKHLRRFIKKLRALFRTVFHRELKYIVVTEYANTAIHHHMIIEGVDLRPVCSLWAEHGTVRSTPIGDVYHLTNLAHYLIKETKTRFDENGRHIRRWAASKNLERPRIEYQRISAKRWRRTPRPRKGYHLDKTVAPDGARLYEHLITGNLCQFYRLIAAGIYTEPPPADKRRYKP